MPTPQTTIRLTEEDKELIAKLKRRYGLTSTTQLIRLVLRMALDSGYDSQSKSGSPDDRTPQP